MQHKPALILYSTSLLYALSLSMNAILVPLYAIALRFSAFEIGLIVSSQAILQIFLRIFGGILTDKLGERIILIYSYSTMALGSLAFAFIQGAFWELFFIQLIIGSSRAVYWAASQSYASRIKAQQSGTSLGYLTSYVNFGMVFGMFGAGLSAAVLGYSWSFAISALMAFIAFILSLMIPKISNRDGQRTFAEILKPIPKILVHKPLYLASIAAFTGAAVIALQGSLYPLYFTQIGFGETMNGFLNALRPLAVALVGFVFGMLLTKWGERWLFFAGAMGTGILLAITPMLTSVWTLSILMLILGLTTGTANVLYQTICSDNSHESIRGMAFSISGLAWSIAHLIIPVIFGLITDMLSISDAFVIAGVVFIIIGLLTKPLFYWLLDQPNAQHQE